MNNNKLQNSTYNKIIRLILMLFAIIMMLAGCSKKSEETADEENSIMTVDKVIQVDDMLKTIDWIGKPSEEIDEDIDDSRTICDIEGTFLGKTAKGSAYFLRDDSTKRKVVNKIFFTVPNSSIQDFYGPLTDLYSGVCDEGMEPYAEVNGGAVQWYTFDAGKALINISQGSKNNFVVVTFTLNPNPGYTGKLVIRKVAEPEIETLPLIMKLKAVDYDNGILTVSISNQSGYDMTYTDDFILAKSDDNGQTYAHLFKTGSAFMSSEKENSYEIADLETQELKCDLRVFGKIEAGMYMIIIGDMRAEFQLIPEEEDNGEVAEAPWFCPECGTKNIDTKICISCGAAKQ